MIKKPIPVLFILSVLFYTAIQILPGKKETELSRDMEKASVFMQRALDCIKDCREKKDLPIDENIDVNRTGIVGVEFSELTTSIGSLKSKRTTTNPNFAGLVVFLLNKAGLKKGDTIAVGASGSFPAVIISVLAASKAMDLDPIMISSLGASQWGANNPDFHWLHMLECLWECGVFDFRPAAVSLGGDKDTGEDLEPGFRSSLIRAIKNTGFPFFFKSDLRENIKARLDLYDSRAGSREIKAFVNIGGNIANIGTDSEVLHVKPGISKIRKIPPEEKRGVLFEMAVRNVPVIHMLYIQGLVQQYGLPWDPIPLPQPGEGDIYKLAAGNQKVFLYLAAVYLLLVFLVFVARSFSLFQWPNRF
jgi:poly-gamma-glutamate system protein